MKNIVFVTACVLLFLTATSCAELADENGLRGSSVGLSNIGMGGGAPVASRGLENLLWNYLVARNMARQMQRDEVVEQAVPDFQRKRSGWKQCSFNAVSCFGRRK